MKLIFMIKESEVLYMAFNLTWDDLPQESKDYVDRCRRNTNRTREQELELKLVQCVIEEQMYGAKERLIFI